MIRCLVLAGCMVFVTSQVVLAQRASNSAVSAVSADPSAAAAHAGASHPSASADACEQSFQRGALTARTTHSTSGWRAGGFASGVLFSVFGVAGASVVASTTAPSPAIVPEGEDSACFRNGYRSRARGRNLSTAAKSALVGAVILPLVFVVRLGTR